MRNEDLVQLLRAAPPRRRRNGLLDMALVALCVVALGGLAWVGVGRFLATPPTASIAVATVQDSPWTGDDEKHCKAAASAATRVKPDGDAVFANPAVTEGFSSLATMVHCKLTTKASRFCSPSEKTALVAMVEDYLSRSDLVVAGLALQGAPMELASSMFGGETTAGRDIYNMQKDATIAFMKPYHDQIRLDLRNMASSGVISASDFGAFMGMGVSPRITAMLDGTEPKYHVCA